MAKNTLSNYHKRVVIRRLACFATPQQVSDFLQAQFGLELKRQSVEFYDPSKNPRLIREWRELFDHERQKFLHEFDNEPLNSLNYRQKERQREMGAKSARLRLDILNEAAGDFYQHAETMRKQGTLALSPKAQALAGHPDVSGKSALPASLNSWSDGG